MNTTIEAGRIVALTQCPATTNDGENILVSGLFELVEFEPGDPSVGLYAAWWMAVPEGTPQDAADDKWLAIEPYTLMQQADPAAWAAELAYEREMDLIGEMMDTTEGKPYFACPMGHPESFDDEDKGHVFWGTGKGHGHLDAIAGPVVATETRCIHCGAIKWEVG